MTTQPDRDALPSSDAPPRVSERARIQNGFCAEIPSEWLDRLVSVWRAAPYGASFEAVGRIFVDAVASAFPDCAIGICIALRPEEGGPIITRKSPSNGSGIDKVGPSRLFADWAYELAVVIPSEPEGSTLHCAAMAPLPDSGLEASFLQQSANIIACALRSARAEAEATRYASELAKLKAQVVQSEKLAGLGQIAAGIVHELNNPLTSIVAYSDYLQKKAIQSAAEPSDIERLRRITEAAERIRSFSHDLVAYARPSSETSMPVAINSVIDRALLFCEHVLTHADIEVERCFMPGAVQVSGISGQLTQVFVNLVTNACHAMAQGGGQLTIVTEPGEPRSVRVKIIDSGHGIPEEHISRIFDPFFTTKGDGRGTGLGLAIVHDIVAAHGGTIGVESKLGRGTTFVLDLPTISQTSCHSSA